MNKHLLPLIVLCGLASPGFSAEAPATPSRTRLTGPLADGTPPPPAPEKPKFIVRRENILKAETHAQGGRQITVQQITPIDLPPPPEEIAPVEVTPAMRALWDQHRAKFTRQEFIRLGATVYRSKSTPTRSHITLWQPDENPADTVAFTPVIFWSSADFCLLTSLPTFIGSDGKSRSLFIAWGVQDIDRTAARYAGYGQKYRAPSAPALPSGPASFKIISGQPTPATLAAIQSLHDLYNDEFPRLQAAYQGRERLRLSQEAEQKANPPQPKNLTLNYWHLPSTPTATPEGGAK
jgi:hypothetical protein